MVFIHEMYAAYMSLCWFISMTLGNALHPIMPLSIIVPIIIGGLPFLFDTNHFENFKNNLDRKYLLSFMPLFWVVIGFWGGIFRHERGHEAWPHFISYIAGLILIGFFVYGLFLIHKNKGYRRATTYLFIINLYFALTISFIAGMSISDVSL